VSFLFTNYLFVVGTLPERKKIKKNVDHIQFLFILCLMNQVNVSLSLAQASVVLYALRHAKAALNLPELCSVIDTIEVSRAEVMRNVRPDDEGDQFPSDLEAFETEMENYS
jgi:hypothetical protein